MSAEKVALRQMCSIMKMQGLNTLIVKKQIENDECLQAFDKNSQNNFNVHIVICIYVCTYAYYT